MRYYTGTNWFIIIYMQIRSNLFVSNQFTGCRLFVWRTCRHSRQVTSIALWQPRQRRQETAVNDIWMTYEWHFLHEFLQRSVATWKHVNDWCSLPIFLQVKKFVLVSQMPFLQGADGPALRIKGRAGNQSGDRGSSGHSCFVWLNAQWRKFSHQPLSHSGRVADAATQSLLSGWVAAPATVAEWRLSGWVAAPATLAATVAEWLSGWVAASVTLALWLSGWVAAPATVAEWLSGCLSHSGRVAEWLLQPLWQRLWQNGWVAASVTLAVWLSGCSSHSGRVAEWLHQPLWQSVWVAEWLRQSHQSMKWIKFLNMSISKQDYMTLTAIWFTKITL